LELIICRMEALLKKIGYQLVFLPDGICLFCLSFLSAL